MMTPDVELKERPCGEKDQSLIPKSRSMTYEDVLTSLGEFGRYQKGVCLLLCMTHINLGIQLIGSVFILAVPAHRCAIPGLQNDTWQIQNDLHASLINASTPPGDLDLYSSCSVYSEKGRFHGNTLFNLSNSPIQGYLNAGMYLTNLNENVTDIQIAGDRHTATDRNWRNMSDEVSSCSRYIYDSSVHTSTISTELNLVCERKLYRSHAQMTMMLGCVVGSQVSGLLADAWGRKISLMIFLLLNIISTMALVFVEHYLLLLPLMFLMGTSGLGIICPAFVLKMEIVGPTKRRIPGIGISIFFAIGEMVLALMAFLLRDWQHLQLASALLTLPYLAFWWLIPESPRWLLSKGRVAEAEVILTRMALVNKVTLTSGVLEKLKVDVSARTSLWKVFVSARQLAGRYFIIFLAWTLASMTYYALSLNVGTLGGSVYVIPTLASMTYYGMSLNVGTLGGSVYVNVVLMGVVELVGFAACLPLLERCGRRVLCSAMFLLAGLACTATVFSVLYAPPDKQWITILLALVGKCGIAGAFAITWLYSSELFPTVVRNSAMGASSLCARLGGIIAPYIANLDTGGEGGRAIPLVIFGVPSIVVCFLLFCLPETRQCRLPETMQDAIDMGRKKEGSSEERV
ncbi:organic cation transporter protein-like [Littorina saxatilis]|uniref:organic cation transporter protein-like n=1 Tax=Littorina saxatilis TaxID=31220 RepID=UPI0038B60991